MRRFPHILPQQPAGVVEFFLEMTLALYGN